MQLAWEWISIVQWMPSMDDGSSMDQALVRAKEIQKSRQNWGKRKGGSGRTRLVKFRSGPPSDGPGNQIGMPILILNHSRIERNSTFLRWGDPPGLAVLAVLRASDFKLTKLTVLSPPCSPLQFFEQGSPSPLKSLTASGMESFTE
ncbi:hypothetical protein FB451DRAFT_1187400 [Mycena latifolia]|nr:hypothetical protein FB451DRAFT_1187400 [Mycena latifolia]